METDKFFKELAKIFDKSKEEISENYSFSSTEWDSLTVLAVAASVDTIYDVIIPVKKLSQCQNVAQLLRWISEGKRGE